MRDELFGFIVGGHDTTTSVMHWLVKWVTAEQGMQAKLRLVLHAAFQEDGDAGRVPSAEAICKTNVC